MPDDARFEFCPDCNAELCYVCHTAKVLLLVCGERCGYWGHLGEKRATRWLESAERRSGVGRSTRRAV